MCATSHRAPASGTRLSTVCICHITQNWRGRPLVSHDVIINLIANTTTQAGLKIRAELDRGIYPIGLKITDDELSGLNLKLAKFHGDWNYTLLPLRKKT
jgi:hypothetical protein